MMILLPPLRVSYRGGTGILGMKCPEYNDNDDFTTSLKGLLSRGDGDTWDEMSSGPQKLYLVQNITLYRLSIEDETLVHVAPELWPLRLLSSLTNKVDDRSEKLGSDILPSHVGL
jgi:hypothetical protein